MADWRNQRFTTLVSAALLAEYDRAVRYPKVRRADGLDDDALERFVGRSVRFGELVVPRGQLRIVSADPDDDRILECAVAGEPPGSSLAIRISWRWSAIRSPILAPRAFLDLLESSDTP